MLSICPDLIRGRTDILSICIELIGGRIDTLSIVYTLSATPAEL